MIETSKTKIKPIQKKMELVNLGTKQEVKEVKVGVKLVLEEKMTMVQLLKEFIYAFTWSYQDITRLDTDTTVHKLPLNKECKSLKQKLRWMQA